MKCDELQQVENPIEWGLYYDKSNVDAAIAELKSENERLNRALLLARANYCHNFRVDWYISRHHHSKMRQSVMENTLIMAEMNCRKKAREYK